ncbi:MAG: hypothetical protein V4629_04265 [Pseudomonadota bacterium]
MNSVKSSPTQKSNSKKHDFIKIIFGIALAVCAVQSAAEDSTPQDQIVSLQAESEFTLLKMKKMVEAQVNCTNKNYFSLAHDHPNYENVLSIIFMAHAARIPVSFEFSGCSGRDNSYPNITSVSTFIEN